jgi:hypothetical protein
VNSEIGLLDDAFVSHLMGQHRAEREDYSFQIWVLLNLVLWHDYWIEGRKV